MRVRTSGIARNVAQHFAGPTLRMRCAGRHKRLSQRRMLLPRRLPRDTVLGELRGTVPSGGALTRRCAAPRQDAAETRGARRNARAAAGRVCGVLRLSGAVAARKAPGRVTDMQHHTRRRLRLRERHREAAQTYERQTLIAASGELLQAGAARAAH